MDAETRGRLGGLTTHARHDSHAIARRARAGLDAKFEREVDPDGVLPEYERARKAAIARRRHFRRLATEAATKRAAERERQAPPPPPDVQASIRWAKRIESSYNISIHDYETMLDQQEGRCALCGAEPSPGKRLYVDHDHACCPGSKSCGRCVRGLLCAACNGALGGYEKLRLVPGVDAYTIRRYVPLVEPPGLLEPPS